jgi:hypothetical protein
MAKARFTFTSFLIRFAMALVLVFASYNPSGYSWYHWFMDATNKLDAMLIFSAVVLLIGWAIYLRATVRSLGLIGAVLAIAFFAALIWVLIDREILSVESLSVMQYIVLVMLSAFLATGISWSHIRRRMTGQVDMDEVDGGLD